MNSINPELQILAARVEMLEAQNRRWKLAGALFVLSGVSLVLMGAKPADRINPPMIRASTVEAQEFILKDETGHVYARLSRNPPISAGKQANGRTYLLPPNQAIPGQAALQFYDDKGDVLWTVPSITQVLPVR
jgi:hypothetical protein